MPRRPMNRLRCSTVTPSASYSSTNAEMPFSGTFAITTTTSATTPLVAHSLRPLSRYPEPSSVGVALVDSRAGSDPTSGSVRRNAEMCVFVTSGSQRCFCSSVPNSSSGSATPIDWCADSSDASDECQVCASASARL